MSIEKTTDQDVLGSQNEQETIQDLQKRNARLEQEKKELIELVNKFSNFRATLRMTLEKIMKSESSNSITEIEFTNEFGDKLSQFKNNKFIDQKNINKIKEDYIYCIYLITIQRQTKFAKLYLERGDIKKARQTLNVDLMTPAIRHTTDMDVFIVKNYLLIEQQISDLEDKSTQ